MAILKDLLVTGAANVGEGVTSPTFTGDLIGNSNTTGKLKTAVNIQIGNSDGSSPGTAVSFDGSSGVILKLPSQITASLNGVAAKASKINTTTAIGSANIPVYIAADGTVTSTGKSFANYLPLAGGTMTGPVVFNGGNSSAASKIILQKSNSGAGGQITDGGTNTLFGFTSSAADLSMGHTSYNTRINGSGARPTYNGSDLALLSDLPTNHVTTNTAQTISGAKTFSASTSFKGGSVEIFGTSSIPTPYIDFHYNNSTADYTSRIIESASGELSINGAKISGGKVWGAVWNDYAELFPRGEETEAGDIIALDEKSEEERYVKAVKGNKALIGVESNEYGYLLGGDANKHPEENLKDFIPVGLAGRVWVKVHDNPELGDYITASEIPGVGEATEDRTQAIGIVVARKRDGKVRIKII